MALEAKYKEMIVKFVKTQIALNIPGEPSATSGDWLINLIEEVLSDTESLETDLAAAQADIAALQADLATAQSDISDLQAAVSDHEARIAALETP